MSIDIEKLAQQVKDIWDELADEMLNLPFVKARDKILNPLDRVDQFEYALKFAKGLSFQSASRLVTWLQGKSSGDISYHQDALKEPAFRRKTARFIVHGHTHHHYIDHHQLQHPTLCSKSLLRGCTRLFLLL